MDVITAWTGWAMVGEFLKLVPGIVLFPLSLVLAWKKFGNKALITYSISRDRFTAQRLSNVVLTNCKDKPLIIHALYIIVDNHALLPIKEFNPPLVVKGLESAVIESDPVSSYALGADPFEIYFGSLREIYVLTTGGRFKCDADPTPQLSDIARKELYEYAQSSAFSFNSHVYDYRVQYGLKFALDEKGFTAFIDSSGYIGLEWPFRINHLRPEEMVDIATVWHTLVTECPELKFSLEVFLLNAPVRASA